MHMGGRVSSAWGSDPRTRVRSPGVLGTPDGYVLPSKTGARPMATRLDHTRHTRRGFDHSLMGSFPLGQRRARWSAPERLFTAMLLFGPQLTNAHNHKQIVFDSHSHSQPFLSRPRARWLALIVHARLSAAPLVVHASPGQRFGTSYGRPCRRAAVYASPSATATRFQVRHHDDEERSRELFGKRE
jgi:hypothetical protein